MAIKNLERDLGVTLLEPMGRGVRLTAAGVALDEAVSPLLAQMAQVRRQVQEVQEGEAEAAVRVGADSDAVDYLLPRAIRRLRRHHPERRFVITTHPGRDSLAGLREGRLDLAVCPVLAVPDGLEVVAELIVERVVLSSGEHPFPTDRPPTAADLVHHPVVVSTRNDEMRRELDRVFAAQGREVHQAIAAEGWEAVKAYVGLGFGVALVPGYCVERVDRRVRVARAGALFGHDGYGVVVREGWAPSGPAERLVAALGQLA
jgi:DNA-binding transcriptional LysR family regulator